MGGFARAAVALALVLGIGAPGACRAAKQSLPRPGKVYTWSFQADTLGQKPAHSIAFGGNWQVVEDSTNAAASSVASTPGAALGDSSGAGLGAAAHDSSAAAIPAPATPAPRHLFQSESDDGVSYHYLNFTRPMLGDLDASVRFRIRSGEIDPSAGLLFQMDPKGTSGYLVRVSGKTGELAFHYLLYGKRRDVKYAKIPPLEAGTWHTLAIARRKSQLRVLYDGKEVLTARDDRYSKGTVGVWAEDDTLADFADLAATAR